MKFSYKGTYKKEETQLPVREHPDGYVPFKEPQSMTKLAIIANGLSFGILFIVGALAYLRGKNAFADIMDYSQNGSLRLTMGVLASLVCMVPHEFLHAICFRDEVQMYSNLKQGLLFVVGTEDMTRAHFVFMSMLPNLVFGFLPFVLYMLFPRETFFAGLGCVAIASGAGDYINVFNCLTQVPKGALVYMSDIHSYWYKKH